MSRTSSALLTLLLGCSGGGESSIGPSANDAWFGQCETCDGCVQDEDCGSGICVDGACEAAVCGDGTCTFDENCFDCPTDCGQCAVCGDGSCGGGEYCAACPQDCGACSDECSPIQGNVTTIGPPAFQCGIPGALTTAIVNDLNNFWLSGMQPCPCDFAGCPFNAWAQPQTPGWIYYRRDVLDWLSARADGPIGAAWFLSHEAGHYLQWTNGIPLSSSKAAELSADCLSGYFLAALDCGRMGMTALADATAAICAAGDPYDSGWFEPGAHGTCTERVSAVESGYAAYSAGVMPGTACAF